MYGAQWRDRLPALPHYISPAYISGSAWTGSVAGASADANQTERDPDVDLSISHVNIYTDSDQSDVILSKNIFLQKSR